MPLRRFLFELCLTLGYAHPDYLLAVLDSKQISEWFEYFKYRRFGPEFETEMRAVQIAVSAAAGGQRCEVQDFLPWRLEDKQKRQTPESLLASLPGGAKAMQELINQTAEKNGDSRKS